ncbi:hypothetical protein ACQEVZ_01530 [Dactylosporangium sp. CA-152071]
MTAATWWRSAPAAADLGVAAHAEALPAAAAGDPTALIADDGGAS